MNQEVGAPPSCLQLSLWGPRAKHPRNVLSPCSQVNPAQPHRLILRVLFLLTLNVPQQSIFILIPDTKGSLDVKPGQTKGSQGANPSENTRQGHQETAPHAGQTPSPESQQGTSAGEDAEEGEPWCTAGGSGHWRGHRANQHGGSLEN